MSVPKLLRIEWIYLDTKTKEFVCKRCQTRAALHLPANAEQLITAMRIFQDQHKKCKAGGAV